MMKNNLTVRKVTISPCFHYFKYLFKLIEVKTVILCYFWVGLFLLISLSTNWAMFDVKIADKNKQKNRQKWRISGRMLKSLRVEYLENKLIYRKNKRIIGFVSSTRIFLYNTRLYSKNLEKKLPSWSEFKCGGTCFKGLLCWGSRSMGK